VARRTHVDVGADENSPVGDWHLREARFSDELLAIGDATEHLLVPEEVVEGKHGVGLSTAEDSL
jgi:hypothetical protein